MEQANKADTFNEVTSNAVGGAFTDTEMDRRGSVEDLEMSIISDAEEQEQEPKQTWREVLMLSFSSLGAIYGDIGTSPLYTLNSIKYPNSPPTADDMYGALSLIFYVFTIIVIVKYVLIVLFLGPNNGEGGQIAIYAKIARYLKIGPKGIHIPGEPEPYDLELLTRQDTSASLKSLNSKSSKGRNRPIFIKSVSVISLLGCFFGCSLVMSDGLLTPTTSVLSAVAGIQVAQPSFDQVLLVSELVLIALFLIQRFGSSRISFTFAPIIFLWMLSLLFSGIYNIAKYHPAVFKSFSPVFAIRFLKKVGIDSFSGIILTITGTEAMFADIGHFGRLPVQLSLSCFVYPILILCYFGQGAYIIEHPSALESPLFRTIPGGVNSGFYWIVFVLATLSTIIASQALILGVFSIVSQLINLDCFPKFKIIHVSKKHLGKVYIPGVNWLLMIGVCCTTAGFKNSNNVTAAYGLGISLDFLLTSILISLCMIYVYNFNYLLVLLYVLIFIPLEVIIVVSNLKKVEHGAWFPLMMAALGFIFLIFWRWARSKKVHHEYSTRKRINQLFSSMRRDPENDKMDLNDRGRSFISLEVVTEGFEEDAVKETRSGPVKINGKFGAMDLRRHDGVGIMYSDYSVQTLKSPNTIPYTYERVVSYFGSLPSLFIFCSTKTLSIPIVPTEERVLISSMKVPGHYRCLLRFGFMEEIFIDKPLVSHILSSLTSVEELAQKFSKCPGEPFSIDDVPILHIFENSTIRSKEINGFDITPRNVIKKIPVIFRKVLIDYVFSPIDSIFKADDRILRLEDEEEEANTKLLVGGVMRI